MKETLLAARGVSHAFAGTHVLTAVDLALRPGQLLLVVGPNGSGKTTLVRILAGVLAARSGEIELAERPLSAYTRREVARRLAVVPQEMLVPASALLGASFLMLADTLARTILAPTELPVGALTALVGGPLFLLLLRRELARAAP